MSKSVKSDGEVNKLVRQMALGALNGASMGERADVDKVLKDEGKLKQCEYQTLLLAGAAYIEEYKDKNWHIQRHIEIKAQQSESYRRFKSGQEIAPTNGTQGEVSPLEKLLSR